MSIFRHRNYPRLGYSIGHVPKVCVFICTNTWLFFFCFIFCAYIMFIYCHTVNKNWKIQKRNNTKIQKQKKFGNRFITFHFITRHSYLMLHGEILFSRLNPRIENEGFTENPNQHRWAHLGGIRAQHSRDKGATRHADQIDWMTYWNCARKHTWIPILSTAIKLVSSGTTSSS